MKKRMIPAPEWGLSLTPPVTSASHARKLARGVRGSKLEIRKDGKGVIRMVPEGAKVLRDRRGPKKKNNPLNN